MESLLTERYAVLDLGSNSFHLKLSTIIDNQIQDHLKHKDFTSLISSIDAKGNVEKKSVVKFMQSIKKISNLIKENKPEHFRAVATNSFRIIKDHKFLSSIENNLGFPIDIVSAYEEAELIFKGVTSTTEILTDDFYIIDIGGSSTEIITIEDRSIKNIASYQTGSSQMHNLFFKSSDNFTSFNKSLAWAQNIILNSNIIAPCQTKKINNKYEDVCLFQKNIPAYGASGTIKAIFRGLKALGLSRKEANKDDLSYLTDVLINKNTKYTKEVCLLEDSLGKDRLSILIAGLPIVISILSCLNINTLYRSNGAIREGVLYDLHQQYKLSLKV